MSKLLLNGLTTKPPRELVPLAESWLSPPEIDVAGEGFRSEGYDAAERAFVLVHEAFSEPVAADFTIQSSAGSPTVNPAIVIKNWGDGEARMTLDGKPMTAGKDLRFGYVQSLEGTDLVVWIQIEATKPLRVTVR
jgi:hypothetical protein